MIRSLIAKIAVLGLAGALLAGCEVGDLEETPPPMGRFLLGHNIAVVLPETEVGPMSRTVEPEVWINAVRTAVNDRFSRYDGDQYFHIAVTVLGYSLAEEGIPFVISPRSVLLAEVNLFRDSDGGTPITEEPKQFTVFEEGIQGIMGSGRTRSAEEQAASMSRNLALLIQEWMLDNPDWFGDPTLMDPAMTSAGRPIQPLKPQLGTGDETEDEAEAETDVEA